jgi:gamma-glutamylcyclotransferase (GGCT)/AIG2-like uncharacterized protein YtfP
VINPHLFVYGTLMSAAGHPMGARLAREGKRLGPASMQGRLYRVAWYPGLVDSIDAEERVHGELFALANPAATFGWLDAYEGVRGGSNDNEYARVERLARLSAAAEVLAWVYLYQRDPPSLGLIADGRWTSSAK